MLISISVIQCNVLFVNWLNILARTALVCGSTIGDLLRIFAETVMIEYSEKQMDPLGQILGKRNRDRLPCESLLIDPEDQEMCSINLCLLKRTNDAESL